MNKKSKDTKDTKVTKVYEVGVKDEERMHTFDVTADRVDAEDSDILLFLKDGEIVAQVNGWCYYRFLEEIVE